MVSGTEEQTNSPSTDNQASGIDPIQVPLLPLAENVIFPGSVYPLTLSGEQAESLVRATEKNGGLVALFLEKDVTATPPSASDLYTVGTLSRLDDVARSADGSLNVTATGIARVRLISVRTWEPHVVAEVQTQLDPPADGEEVEQVARQVQSLYRGLLAGNPEASTSLLPVLETSADPLELAYLVASTIPISPQARQAILETDGVTSKLLQLLVFLGRAHEMSARKQIASASHIAMPASSGEAGSAPASAGLMNLAQTDQAALDRLELERCLRSASLPLEAARIAQRELDHLASLVPAAPEYNIARSYLQWLADLPWQPGDEPDFDLDEAMSILERNHYGLAEIKARIIEYLAVRKLKRQRTGDSARDPEVGGAHSASAPAQPVLCLVGPPGVGKTSLGRSIAEALNRPFVRISLGGVTDEAEIRGHRRTYVGAMPGRVIQSLARLGSNQPVMMLDELDKFGTGVKGDPAAALLEILDSEQQNAFVDHYIDVPFDLSSIFFVTTANNLEDVPEALRDRLEVIRLSSYTEEEKREIALRHLIPLQMEWHALNEGDIVWQPEAVLEIIRSYTREAGVRQLEREIATVCRRIAMLVTQEGQDSNRPYTAGTEFISEALGTPRFLPDEPESTDQPGIVTGVFWTPVGGDIMHIEAIMMPGRKTLTITGQLGEIMRESAQAALSYVRAHAVEHGIEPDFYERHDIHLHVPSGAVAKDGPSAGVTLAVALVSLLTQTSVPGDTAMTGELTLRGRILPVGGIKEKVLAARRAGLRRVVLPSQNRRDLDDVQPEILGDLDIVFVDTMDQVLDAVFSGQKGRPAASKKAARMPRLKASPRSAALPSAAMPRS